MGRRIKARPRRFVVKYRHNGIAWRWVYYTLAHAEQYARALRSNGLAGVVVEQEGGLAKVEA